MIPAPRTERTDTSVSGKHDEIPDMAPCRSARSPDPELLRKPPAPGFQLKPEPWCLLLYIDNLCPEMRNSIRRKHDANI